MLDDFTSKRLDVYMRSLMTQILSPLKFDQRILNSSKSRKGFKHERCENPKKDGFKTIVPQRITYKISIDEIIKPDCGGYKVLHLYNGSFKKFYNTYKERMHAIDTSYIKNTSTTIMEQFDEPNTNTMVADVAITQLPPVVNETPEPPVVNETPEPPVVNETPEPPVVNETPEPPVVKTDTPNIPKFIEQLIPYYERIYSTDMWAGSKLRDSFVSFKKNRIYTPFHQMAKYYRDTLIDSVTGYKLNEAYDIHAAYSVFMSIYAAKHLHGTDEVNTFYNRVISGQFYEEIMWWAQDHKNVSLTRDEVKEAVNSIYCANHNKFSDTVCIKTVYSYFKQQFPNILELINNNRGKLVTELADIEMNIISTTAMQINNELEHKGLDGMAVSLHDALFCTDNLSAFGYNGEYITSTLLSKVNEMFEKYTNPLL